MKDGAICVHPCEVRTAGTVDPPCLQNKERNELSDDNALPVADLSWIDIRKSIGWSNYVGRYASGDCRSDDT